MAALDLLGRHWALQIIWELNERPRGFRELQRRCVGISPTVLSKRLKELREAELIRIGAARKNELTSLGKDLFLSIGALKTWVRLWASELARKNSKSNVERRASA